MISIVRRTLIKLGGTVSATPPYKSEGFYKNSLIFHLRGGIDYSKLNFKHKTMMKMLYHSLKNKPVESLTQEDKALIETYNTKVDFVDYDSLKQIVEVIQ